MANTIKIKRGSGSDPAASDMVLGEPVLRTDTAELFFKKDDGSVAKVSGGGGGPDFKYLALRNAANNGAASYPNADFTLVTSGTTNAITPAAANTLLVSVNGVIQKPNTGTSTPSSGFALSGSTIKFGANISAAPDFILYQESGGIGEPSDETVSEAKLKVSNSPVNGYFLSAQSGNTGGLTWAAPVATSCTGNSATATALATARTINGTSFDGTANITVTAAAGTLTGNTLNSSVTASSLTSLGDLAGLTVNGDATFTGANYNVLWDKSDNALEFADEAKAKFGTNGNLEIYYDASSYITNGTAGHLIIKTTNSGSDINLECADDFFVKTGVTQNSIIARDSGQVELYYSGNPKFETLSVGANVTGFLGVNTTTPASLIDARATSGASITVRNTGTVASIAMAVGSSTNQLVSRGINTSTARDLIFMVGSTTATRLDSNGHLRPETDSTFDLGSNAIRWRNFYADTLYGDGSNLTGISAGATGGGSDEIFYENSQTITTDYTITSGKNAMSAGPITINNGVSVTVPSGSTYTIV